MGVEPQFDKFIDWLENSIQEIKDNDLDNCQQWLAEARKKLDENRAFFGREDGDSNECEAAFSEVNGCKIRIAQRESVLMIAKKFRDGDL